MAHALSARNIVAMCLVLTACATPEFSGFIMPCGGNTASVRFPQRVEMARVALKRVAEARKKGAKLGSFVCGLHVANRTEDFKDLQELYERAGMPSDRWKTFVIASREDAKRQGADIGRDCAIVYIPGGDQTYMREIWKDTPVAESLRSIVERGGGLMGNSAGAMILGSAGYYPHSGRPSEALTPKRLLEGTSYFEPIPNQRGFVRYDTGEKDQQGNPLYFASQYVDEVAPSFILNDENDDSLSLPRFFLEVHTDSRERLARLLAIMAAWEYQKQHSPRLSTLRKEAPALGIAIDNDTAPLIYYSREHKGFVAEVYGGRAVEFLFPTEKSKAGLQKLDGLFEELEFVEHADGSGRSWKQSYPVMQPFYTNVQSELLLAGGKIVLSGPHRGKVLSEGTMNVSREPKELRTQECLAKLPERFVGEVPARSKNPGLEMREASAVYFQVPTPLNPFTKQPARSEPYIYLDETLIVRDEARNKANLTSKLDSYLVGNLMVSPSKGCGLWIPQAWNYYGQPVNRLNAMRYALGLGKVSFAVALPWGMEALRHNEWVRFVFNRQASIDDDPVSPWARKVDAVSSSVLVYDMRLSSKVGIATYVYRTEYNAERPVQTGSWIGGKVHLLKPEQEWNIITGDVH